MTSKLYSEQTLSEMVAKLERGTSVERLDSMCRRGLESPVSGDMLAFFDKPRFPFSPAGVRGSKLVVKQGFADLYRERTALVSSALQAGMKERA